MIVDYLCVVVGAICVTISGVICVTVSVAICVTISGVTCVITIGFICVIFMSGANLLAGGVGCFVCLEATG